MRRGTAGAGTGTLRAGGRWRVGGPDRGAVGGRWRPSWPVRAQAPASGRLGQSHRDREGGVTAGGRGTGQRSVARRLYICPHTVNTPPAARARHAGRTEPGCARRRGASLDRALSSPLGWEVACAPFGRGGARRLVEWPGCAPGCLPSGRPSPWAGHRVHRAWVGDRRAARIAGSIPARAPMSRAAARPPAQASGGMMVAQPLCRA